MFTDAATEDFFRARLDHMIDLRQPLVVLASRLPWQQLEASLAHLLSRKARTGLAMPDLDLFGEAVQLVDRKSNAGRPRVPLRTMIALLYLKHAFNRQRRGAGRALVRDPTLAILQWAGVLRGTPALRRHHPGQIPPPPW